MSLNHILHISSFIASMVCEPYSSVFSFLFFSNYRVCVDFSGPFYLFLFIFHNLYPFWVVSL